MTLPSRRKRRITARAATTAGRTLASLAAWLLLAGPAPAQAPPPLPPPRPIAIGQSSGIQPVRFQPPAGAPEPRLEFELQLVIPGLKRLSRLESDEKLFERIRQETLAINPNERPEFPESPLLSRDRYMGRGDLWHRRQLTVEPNYVCYGKMQAMFEDRNAERYGWDFGPVSVPLCHAKFYADLAMLPLRAFANPCRRHECGTGYCLPGDPVPFMLYPVEVNVKGVAAEVAVIAALCAIFP
jgi:hypothetical protein